MGVVMFANLRRVKLQSLQQVLVDCVDGFARLGSASDIGLVVRRERRGNYNLETAFVDIAKLSELLPTSSDSP